MKKAISILVCIFLTLSVLPFSAIAEEPIQYRPDPSAEIVVLDTVTEYNPIYVDIFKPEQFENPKAPEDRNGSKAATSTPVYSVTLEDAGTQIRTSLKAHLNSFSVYWAVPKSLFDTYGAAAFQGLVWSEAVKITTNGREGDYLAFSWWERNCYPSYVISDDGNYVLLTLAYYIVYVGTTAAQELQMQMAADAVIESFQFTEATSAYDKIRTIYDYVATNIRYAAPANVDVPLYHSAYSAIILKETVCQGYAALLYYMLWRCEIPCRVIVGMGSGGGHAWNTVWLRGQWYSLDATWDENPYGADHTYFLRGKDTGFYGSGYGGTHYPYGYEDTFLSGRSAGLVYETSSSDYTWVSDDVSGNCAFHTAASDTYTTDSGDVFNYCSRCGHSKDGPLYYVDGDWLYYVSTFDFTATVIDYSGSSADISIPSAPYGIPVRSVGMAAFMNNLNLTSVIIPEGVTRIEEAAFIGCNSLRYITIPASVTRIDDYAFSQCNEPLWITYGGSEEEWDGISKGILDFGEYYIHFDKLTDISITSDKPSAVAGEPITWTALGNGGSGALQYCFWVYQGSTIVEKGDYGTSNAYTYTPTAAGSYRVRVFAKDAKGTVVSKYSGNITVTAAAPLTVGTITASTASTNTGTAITWTASSTGGSGAKQYCFHVYQGSTIVKKGDYGTAATYTYTPTAAGGYRVRVFVKDAAGTVANKYSATVTVTAASAEPLAITGVTANPASASTGTAITWTASASGGSGAKEYCFWVYQGSAIVEKGAYGASATYTYTPTAAGGYRVRVFVKDSGGTVVSQYSASVPVT